MARIHVAVHEGDDWRRKLEPSVGDFIFNESADYEVNVTTNQGVEVFTSGTETSPKSEKSGRTFTASALRDFAILAGNFAEIFFDGVRVPVGIMVAWPKPADVELERLTSVLDSSC